ncbi:MAG: D-aminoacylase [Candidatus Latescibacterota bacterium]|nr:D-aminoacylase [Candidatus Latescibacterota bacterium]
MAQLDVLIRNAKIVDGTGSPWRYGEIAIRGERIVEVGSPGALSGSDAAEVVDARGKVVCPGFIDIQSHSIVPLMIDGCCLSKITQGVTTEIMGEGSTPAPFGGRIEKGLSEGIYGARLTEWVERARRWHRFGDWLSAMVEVGVSPNVGSFLGAGTLREYAMGLEMRAPTGDELAQMRRVMAEAMEDGAFGPSYALIYPPDAYAETEEIIAVCKEAARRGGLYITHIRSEGDAILDAVDEAIRIGREGGLPVEIYHLKAAGRRNWDTIHRVVEKIDAARARGLDVTADMYPYAASGTGLSSVLPPWAAAEGKLFERLEDPVQRAEIKAEAMRPGGRWEAMVDQHGEEGVMPIGFQQEVNKPYVGLRLSEVARQRGQDWFDAVCDLLLSERQRISTIYFSMSEENVAMQLGLPWIKVSTDAGGHDPAWAQAYGPVHPRGYGTYPRVLGQYVREQKRLRLEEAIHKMSGAVAQRLSLADRGVLMRGMQADIAMFDEDEIGDRATFEAPHQLSVGVLDVWVNGVRVVRDGTHTGATPGQVVRPNG